MKKLLQLDKLDGDRKGVLRTIIENGEIRGNIEESFPAKLLVRPQIFISSSVLLWNVDNKGNTRRPAGAWHSK